MGFGDRHDPHDLRDWYGRALGWAVHDGRGPRPGPGVELRTGVRFDVLDVPVAAGLAVLRRFPLTGPAAVYEGRALLLVAAGTAEELPGLLAWLDWSGIELDLAVRGAGGRMPAPAVPRGGVGVAAGPGIAEWLRAPVPGREVEPTLPSVAVTGCGPQPGVVGLVRLVGTVATECHRTRILPARTGRPTDSRPTGRRLG